MNDLTINPFDWVTCDDDLDYPVIVEWGSGSKGFLVADSRGRRKDVWQYLDDYPAYICDLDNMVMVGAFGGMYEQITIYIIDYINPDTNLVEARPWFSKINGRVGFGKESKFTDTITQVLRNRAKDTARSSLYYGLETR